MVTCRTVFILFFPSLVYAQPGRYDDVPKHLVPFPVVEVVPEPVYYWTPHITIDTGFYHIVVEGPSMCVWSPPPCGDQYDENGNHIIHADCIGDVLHGKVIYWSNEGAKTREETYHKGHRTKVKMYDYEGRLQSLQHNDYKGNLHGICAEYNYEEQSVIVTTYEHGIKHGSEKEFMNDKLVAQNKYRLDTLVEEKRTYEDGGYMIATYGPGPVAHEEKVYSPKGKLIFHELMIDGPDTGFCRIWDDNGVLQTDGRTIGKKRIGTWVYDFDPADNQKTVFDYRDGNSYSCTYYKNEKPWLSTTSQNGRYEITTQWYDSGDTSHYRAYLDTMGTCNLKAWAKDGRITDNYILTGSTDASEQLLAGTGFYTCGNFLHVYKAADKPLDWMPIERWIIFEGDTMRQEYVKNEAGLPDGISQVYSSNNFSFDKSSGEWRREGLWKTYEANTLTSVVNYQAGLKQGWALYKNSVFELEGLYENDLMQGIWRRTETNQTAIITYINDIPNGEAIYVFGDGSKIIRNYVNGIEHGAFREFYPSGTLKTEGSYLNGLEHGWWNYYNQYGQLILEGEFENGVKVRKWFEYIPGENGEFKKSKIHYS